jgi:hypothetical protein
MRQESKKARIREPIRQARLWNLISGLVQDTYLLCRCNSLCPVVNA